MKVQFEVITYEKDRLDYFTALMKNAQMKYDRLYKRFERSPHLFDGTDALDDAGRNLRFYQDVVAMLEQDCRKQSWWTSVKNPPETYRDDYGELIPFLVCCRNTEYPFRAVYDGRTWGDGIGRLKVTHWMPLPEPPKGE